MVEGFIEMIISRKEYFRNPWLDCARGVAVITMIIYHFAWDLSFFGLIDTDINSSTFWRSLAQMIAGSFLFLSGISLYFAHGNGIRWPAFLRRLAILAGAATLVTLATWCQFPTSYIFFGILHCIALSSIIGLVFLRVHWLVTILASIFAFALPYVFTHTFFDTSVLAFLGLRTLPIRTNDFVPLLPWISPMLAGVGVMNMIGKFKVFEASSRTSAAQSRDPDIIKHIRYNDDENISSGSRVLRPRRQAFKIYKQVIKPFLFLGRHSLIIYLLHQPILFQATGFVSGLKTKKVDEVTSSFVSSCEQSCTAQGRDKQTCIETCFCTVDGLKATGVWAKISTSIPDEATRLEISNIAKTCQR
jgi:uncharacterized membrane protein